MAGRDANNCGKVIERAVSADFQLAGARLCCKFLATLRDFQN
jgi:hypothetical protein